MWQFILFENRRHFCPNLGFLFLNLPNRDCYPNVKFRIVFPNFFSLFRPIYFIFILLIFGFEINFQWLIWKHYFNFPYLKFIFLRDWVYLELWYLFICGNFDFNQTSFLIIWVCLCRVRIVNQNRKIHQIVRILHRWLACNPRYWFL